MTTRATGTFTTTIEPLSSDDDTLGRMRVEKVIQGDLVGFGRAQMLSVGTPIDGSAGYVALDHITGTLHGRSGTFVLQHSGVLDRGAATLTVTVVPDSGTDELLGLTGTFEIDNRGAEHHYVFTYALEPR
ncbi:DUF3224 domain-containing protein [Actinoplanes sp. RD1]|uniref:DUF3224 domain-containing protein n=1 Tax=Actinoplanes sp. RD1 TaxID=3064538 RepID=UPI002741D56F|nr:DUF3224 domain-containing protein [Actinoplanes sp. RD1]